MESDISGSSARVVLKTVSRMPRTFINQLYAVDRAVAAWVSLGSLSYAACAYYLESRNSDKSCKASFGEQVASVEWTFQVQTAAFGAVLLLNLLNLGMRQHLLPFKCNLLLLYINGVAFVTDLLLWWEATPVSQSSSGRPFAPLRYVQWCHSTPTMIYMLALLADCRGWRLTVPLLSDVAMVLSGLAACYCWGLLKGTMTVLSFGTFAIVLFFVYGMFQKTLSIDCSPEQRGTLRTVLALLLALWSAFPVVWLAADWHLMSPQAEAVCWGVCDYLAKVVFSSQLWQSNLTEVQLRRDRALEAWEATNRVEAVARLTALLKQRDDLLSTLSHELRTPLAGIVALSEGLCREVAAVLPSCGQNLATVRATATCMLNIVTSTLDSFAARRGGEPGGMMSAVVAGDALGSSCLLQQHPPCFVGDDCGPVAPTVPLRPLELRPLVETVTTVLRPLAHDGVSIVSDLPTDLPSVAADATRLSQVLYNLVGNAMRFTSHGEVRVTARVLLPDGPAESTTVPPPPMTRCADAGTDLASASATTSNVTSSSSTSSGGAGSSGTGSLWRYTRPRLSMSSNSSCSSTIVKYPPGSQVEVSVEDTGVGIAQELLDELFLPYRTGPAAAVAPGDASAGECSVLGNDGGSGFGHASKSIGGTGLGLYLVRLALRAQGSDITADSAPGIGSVFRFRLPVAQLPPQQTQPHPKGGCEAPPQQQQKLHHSRSSSQRSHLQWEQQQPQGRRGASLDERRPSSVAAAGGPTVAPAGSTLGSRLSASVFGDCSGALVSSMSTAATAVSDGTDGVPTVPTSPKPSVPSSPKPWIASATARLVQLGTAVTGGRVGSSIGGGASAVATRRLFITEALPALHGGSPSRYGRLLRMSLDEAQNRRMHLPPQPLTSQLKPQTGGPCSSLFAASCCGPEPGTPIAGAASAPAAANAASLSAEGATAAAAAAATALFAAASGVPRPGPALAATPPPVRVAEGAATPTPTPTPTAAVNKMVSGPVGTSGSAAAFAAAHAIEQGRAAATAHWPRSGGLRPNFRHKNNGILQVLSVDDDPINQLVACQMLTSQSWKVVKCMNGPEALAHLQLAPRPGTAVAAAAAAAASAAAGGSSLSASDAAAAAAAAALAAAAAAAAPLLLPAVLPDCVLLDVMMPGMSGFEVCRKLREHFSSAQLPIIIVSAKGDTAAVDEAFESGADDYMTKPYKRAEMVARIKAQIRTRDSIMEAAAAAAAAVSPPVAPTAPPPVAAVLPSPAVEAPEATGSASGAVTAGSTPRACTSAVAGRSLLGCSAASDQLQSPLSPPASQPQPQPQGSRPASVDALLLQQPTPDSIKARMEVKRGGLDGSWGKVGLYKVGRERLHSRSLGAPEAATPTGTAAAAAATTTAVQWDVSGRAASLKEPVASPATALTSPCGAVQLPDVSLAAAAAASVCADSCEALRERPNGLLSPMAMVGAADATVGASRLLPALSENTVMVSAAELVTALPATPGACGLNPVLDGRGTIGAHAATAAPKGGSSTAAAAASSVTTASAAASAADTRICGPESGSSGDPAVTVALLREVLMEVRRKCAVEADIERLTSRVAMLRTACCTLAAERDGWRRQARELRALLATGVGGAAPDAASATAAAAAIAAGGPGLAAGPPAQGMSLMEALAAAHGSRSSGDSLPTAVGCVAAGAAAGGGAPGPLVNGPVAAQLEDLKKEASLLKQQLSIALASIGNASVGNASMALGQTDTGGSRMFGLVIGPGPVVRPPRGPHAHARTLDSPHSAAMASVAAADGEVYRSGGGAAPPSWGEALFPGPPFAAQPDLLLTTEASGLSAGSGTGGPCDGGCASGDGGACRAKSSGTAPAALSPVSLPSAAAAMKPGKKGLARIAASSSVAAPPTAAGVLATNEPPQRAGLATEAAPAVPHKIANGVANGGGVGGAGGGQDTRAATVTAVPSQAAAAVPALPPKPDAHQLLGELRGSSAASNGGRRSSVEDDRGSQPSSAGRASLVPPQSSSRGSRSRVGCGNGGGGGGGGGILRLLCSKGALPGGSPPSSPSRRLSQQQ